MILYGEVTCTGGAGFGSALSIGDVPKRVKVGIISTVANDFVEVTFNGSTTNDKLGPLGDRPMENEYAVPASRKVQIKCASNAVARVLVDKL